MGGGKEMNVSSKSLSDHVVWNGNFYSHLFCAHLPIS